MVSHAWNLLLRTGTGTIFADGFSISKFRYRVSKDYKSYARIGSVNIQTRRIDKQGPTILASLTYSPVLPLLCRQDESNMSQSTMALTQYSSFDIHYYQKSREGRNQIERSDMQSFFVKHVVSRSIREFKYLIELEWHRANVQALWRYSTQRADFLLAGDTILTSIYGVACMFNSDGYNLECKPKSKERFMPQPESTHSIVPSRQNRN